MNAGGNEINRDIVSAEGHLRVALVDGADDAGPSTP